jgi:hypothetical protein
MKLCFQLKQEIPLNMYKIMNQLLAQLLLILSHLSGILKYSISPYSD